VDNKATSSWKYADAKKSTALHSKNKNMPRNAHQLEILLTEICPP
jgi:hypothetical protein